jgi:hypothetical protein
VNRHLTPEEISARVAGERKPALEGHLAECGECQAAVERLDRALARFGGAVKQWSAREFAGTRPFQLPSRSLTGFGLRFAAAVAMVVVAVAVPVYRERRAADLAQQDEALLQEVQADISRSVPLPMETLANLERSGK